MTETMAMPCPFCGATGDLIEVTPWHGGGPDKHMVSCINDDCEAQPQVTGETRSLAIAAWNRRAESAKVSALRASHAELREALKDLLALPVAIKEFGYLDKGIGTATPNAAWLRARAALARTKDGS